MGDLPNAWGWEDEATIGDADAEVSLRPLDADTLGVAYDNGEECEHTLAIPLACIEALIGRKLGPVTP